MRSENRKRIDLQRGACIVVEHGPEPLYVLGEDGVWWEVDLPWRKGEDESADREVAGSLRP